MANAFEALSPERKAELLQARSAGGQLEVEAGTLGLTIPSLHRYLRTYRNRTTSKLKTIIPKSTTPKYKAPVLKTNNAVIISDIEIPDHDSSMLKKALQVGIAQGIKTLIIGGDILATDQVALNSWVSVYKAEKETTYATAIDTTRQIINAFGEWFTDIHIIEGNHDDRIARKTGGEVYLEMFLHDTPATFHRYQYMYIKSSRAWTYICHQRNYSKTPVRLGQQLWEVVNAPDDTKCNIILAHTHITQSGFSPDGKQEVYSLGTCRDPRRTEYAAKSATKFPQWNQSFLIMQDGYFTPLSKRATNWSKWI